MTITTLRPNADSNGIVWTRNPVSGGAFDKLSDNNATTYITSPGTGSLTYQGIDFASTTILTTQRIRAIRIGVQYRFVTAGYLEVRVIRQGLTYSSAVIVQQSSVSGSASTPYSTWLTSDPGGYEWTQSS